ncbi:uncharacterized protein N7511_003701 [Penicillium nucicola]|uniref:uncharacterized protein n=1 Tax=Penicillium nucicola TaxID=1850975 RepID=UPI00254562F4|nr:uncharacterized protein N7511_003701 [Penicillium nucicola]KAJ5766085.1 hypothetical protein N7511_003701 [Penicillium nucicola]
MSLPLYRWKPQSLEREELLATLQRQVRYFRYRPERRSQVIDRLKEISQKALDRLDNPPQAYDSRLEQLYKALREYLPSAIEFLMSDPQYDLRAADAIAQICLASTTFNRVGVDVSKAGTDQETAFLP